jgi:acetyl esterase/lipase
LSILYIFFFITSFTATVSAANCWNGKGNHNKGSFNGNCSGSVNLDFFNGKNNVNLNVGNQTCGCGDQTSPPPSTKNKFTDIAYATKSETQKLDIYLPNEGKDPFPGIITFHGGGFSEGAKSGDYIDHMLQGLNHGYAVVTVDYRLSGEAKFPAAINDANASIRFIKVNAAQYNLNPNKIALWDVSAGGNLASLAGR